MTNEIYIPIKGYENLYEVSNLGNVRSLPRLKGRAGRVLKQERIVKSATTYKRVSLCKEGKVKRFAVHRLVASAFLPNLENKPEVNHIDFNGSNNNLTNLEWCTRKENMEHSAKYNPRTNINPSPTGIAFYTTEGIEKSIVTKRIKQEKLLDRWVGVELGYTTIVSWNFVDKDNRIINLNRKCRICGTESSSRGLIKLRESINKNKPMMCKSCATKVSRYGFIPDVELIWKFPNNLIKKIKHEKYKT